MKWNIFYEHFINIKKINKINADHRASSIIKSTCAMLPNNLPYTDATA